MQNGLLAKTFVLCPITAYDTRKGSFDPDVCSRQSSLFACLFAKKHIHSRKEIGYAWFS